MMVVGMTASAYAETISITTDDTQKANSSTTYVQNYFEVKSGDFNFQMTQVNPSSGQMKVNATGASGFNLYNTSAIDGITSIVVTTDVSKDQGTWHMTTSADKALDASATNKDIAGTTSGNTVTFTVPEGTDASYFHINLTTKGKGTVKFTKIEINYNAGAATLLPAGLSFPEKTYLATLGEAFESPVLSKDTNADVVYSSSDESVATIDAATGVVTLLAGGKTTISATAEANDTYSAGSASYDLTVIDSTSPVMTIVWKDLGYANAAAIETYTSAPLTFTFSGGSNTSNSPAYYTTGEAIRLYAGNTMTVAADDGYVINKIEFTVGSKDPFNQASTASTGTLNTTDAMWTAAESTRKVTITQGGSSGHVKISKMVIYLTKSDVQKESSGLAFPEDAYSVVFGDTFTAPILSKATDGEITYSSSNEEVATVADNGEVTILAPGTTVITANSAETDSYYAGEASYTLSVMAKVSSIKQLYQIAEADNSVTFIADFAATVTYQDNNTAYTYFTYGESCSLIYDSKKQMTAYQPGDVIPAGWSCTYTEYSNLPQLIPVERPVAATETAAVKYDIVKEITADMINQIVILENVDLYNDTPEKGSYTVEYYGEDITFYNRFSNPVTAAGEYDIRGAVSIFKDQLQFQPIEFATAGTLGVNAIEAAADSEAEYYTLQGVRVANPETGLYIRFKNGKAEKIIVK